MTISDLAETSVTLAGGWLPGKTRADYFPIGGDHVDQHQLEMFNAISRGANTLLNTNATGAGKTLSWAAPVIRSDGRNTPQIVLATYPTTALIEDQRETLLEYFRNYYGTDIDPWASERTFDLFENEHTGGGEAVLKDGNDSFPLENRVQKISATANPSKSTAQQLREAEERVHDAERAGLPTILLTTPDTLTNISTNRFRDNDVKQVIQWLDAIVVDEFHLATDRARRLLPFHLDMHRSLSGRYLDTFVFLSATPEPSYVARIDRAFDHTRVVDDIEESTTDGESSRQILPELKLGVKTNRQFTNGQWLAENVSALAETYEPPGQMLVIVDSVREVEVLTKALEAETSLSTGRVYGWKKEGRAEAIENSDVIVGNTAVEVGVDFKEVNRLIFTGYEASSALQRIGRMRYRSQFSDYGALMITRPQVQSAILDQATDRYLAREDFDRLLHSEIDSQTECSYYDILCGAYTRYLWDMADDPLSEEFVNKSSEFSKVAYNHFGGDFEEFFDQSFRPANFWENARRLVENAPTENIFSELHDYRSSQFSCIVIDAIDEDERLKSYSLNYVLKHREGEVISLDEIPEKFERIHGNPLSDDEEAFLLQIKKYATCAFITTGTCTVPRGYFLDDFRFVSVMRDRAADGNLHRAISVLANPEIRTDPPVDGLENIDLGGEKVLVQFMPSSPGDVRQRFSLGPYASIVPTSEGEALVLGDDAIKVHAQLIENRT